MPSHSVDRVLSLAAAGPFSHGTEGSTSSEAVRNLLLASLPADELARMLPHLETVRLDHRTKIFVPGVPIRHVYFPETAVISVVNLLSDDTAVEVGTIGCEGMAGLALFLAEDVSPFVAIAQVPGVAQRMSADAFLLLASVPGALHDILLRYAQAFLCQVAQTAACNARHLVDQRCARWLLMTHDRVVGDRLPLTQEFLAFMLGVRRAGVSVAMHDMQDAGVIRYTRGAIEVVNRPRLEAMSCECYETVRKHFCRLLPRPGTVPVRKEG